ncbi:MAG: hypothetical protein IKY33_01680 [Clostridia bacterium]|nr:hypothetical protein [Clostridia bacterium]
MEKFKDTIFKDENGNLLSLWHWTSAIFDEFANGEFGFHFGTLKAAHDRYSQIKEENPDLPTGVYKEVYLNITNPIEMSDGAGEWSAAWVALQLLENGMISKEQYDHVSTLKGFYETTYSNPAAEAVRQILKDNGYDGIIYANQSENIGSISVIALDPDQILTVAENGVLKENCGVSESDGQHNESGMDRQSMDAVYMAGKTGASIESVYDGEITETVQSIYEDGQRDGGKYGTTTVTLQKGKGQYTDTSGSRSEMENFWIRFAEKTGIDVQRVSEIAVKYKDSSLSENGAAGKFVADLLKILISEKAMSEKRAFGHELGEALFALLGDEFDSVGNVLIDHYLSEHTVKELDLLILEEQSKYGKVSHTTYPAAKKEVICNLLGELIDNERNFTSLVEWVNASDMSAKEKTGFIDKIKKLIQKIISALRSVGSGEYIGTDKQSRAALQKPSREMQVVLHALDALVTRLNSLQNGKTVEIRGTEGESRHQLDENLGQQLEDWRKHFGKAGGTYNGKYFELGTTPDIFVKHGAPKVDLIMYEDCIVKINGQKHEIPLSEIAKLPSQLNDPILLFKGSVPNSFVALTELKNMLGHDIVVAVHIDKKYKRSVINKIASVYSKTDEKTDRNKIKGYVNYQIAAGNLIDASIKKAPLWFTNRGLQLPKLVQTIIDANTKITQNDPSVKNNSMQKSQNNSGSGELSIDTETVDETALAEATEKSNAQREKTLGKYTAQMDESASVNGESPQDERFLYETLIKKPRMKIVTVDDTIRFDKSKPKARDVVVELAIDECKKIGSVNTNGNVLIYVDDLETNVMMSKKGLRHSLDKRFDLIAPFTVKAGEIIKNAILLNEADPLNKNVTDDLVLVSLAKNQDNKPIVVRFMVDRITNELNEVDILHAIDIKKGPAAHNGPHIADVPLEVTGHDISIVDFLDYVNYYFPDVLSMDVLKHYGHSKRPESELQGVRYSLETETADETDVERLRAEGEALKAQSLGKYTAQMDAQARESGRLPQGERARRDIAVPRKVNGKKTMRWARTFFESGVGEPDMVDPIAEELLNEGLAYKVIGNNKAIDVAEKIVELKGYEGAINAFAADVDAGKLSKEVVALGQVLLKVAAEKKDAHNFKKLVVMLSEIETIAGQTVQAASMLKRMDGETKLFAVKRLVDKLNKELAEGKYGKKGAGMKITIEDGDGSENVIRVDPDLIARLLEAGEDTAVADAVVVEIQKDIGRQMPHSFNDTWNAWRYLSMLCNPTTHIRNFIGNALFMPVVRMKNSIKRVIELMAVHGENKEYTTKLLPASKAARRFARADAEKMETILKSGGKYNEQDVTEQMRQKLPGFLNKINHWNSAAMEWEDWVFLRYHYASALARYIDINHIDPDSITDVQLKRARDHATREALKATYRDASRLATAINQFSKNNGRVVEMIVEGILPFKKTPINVLRRGMEYSPVGLMDTMLRGAVRVVKGEITVNEWADGFAAGLSGTLIMALGGWLCAMGILQGGFGVDDDDKEDKAQDDLKKLSGVREYSLRIGDVSYTIDWAAPVAIPLFMGVELCEALKEESGNMWDKVWDAVVDGTDVIVNMSMLDGLQGTIDAIKYEDSSVLAIVENSVINYYGQALPTLFGKTASFFDGTGRSNYIDKDSFWPETVQRIANKIKAKAPVWSATRNAYVDEFGRETVENNWALRFVQNFISPGYYSVIRYGELEELMSEIYAEADEPAIIPTVADKSFNVKGKKVYLSAKEYETFAKERGKVAYDIMTKMIRSRNFDALNYNEMQDVLKKAYEYSGALAKSKVSDYKLDDWQKEAYALEKQGVKVSDFILYKYQTKDSENRAEAFQKLRSMGLSEKQAFDYVGRIQPTFKSRTEGTDYVAKDIYTSIVSGGTMHKIIYTNILNAKIKAGKTEKEAKSSIRSELTECFKSAYLNAKNDTERIKIRSQIFQSGAYGTQADVDKTITQWVKDSKK